MTAMMDFDFVPGFRAALAQSADASAARERLARLGSRGGLSARSRAMIALTIAHECALDYCIWAQTCVARSAGLTGEDIAFASAGSALHRRDAAITRFAREVARRAAFSEDEMRGVPHDPLLTRDDLLEIAACAGAAVIDNYLIHSVAPAAVRAVQR